MSLLVPTAEGSRLTKARREPPPCAARECCSRRAQSTWQLRRTHGPEIQSDARALAGMRALDSRPDRAVRTDMHTSLVMHTLVSFPFLCVNQATKQKLQQLAQAMLPCWIRNSCGTVNPSMPVLFSFSFSIFFPTVSRKWQRLPFFLFFFQVSSFTFYYV